MSNIQKTYSTNELVERINNSFGDLVNGSIKILDYFYYRGDFFQLMDIVNKPTEYRDENFYVTLRAVEDDTTNSMDYRSFIDYYSYVGDDYKSVYSDAEKIANNDIKIEDLMVKFNSKFTNQESNALMINDGNLLAERKDALVYAKNFISIRKRIAQNILDERMSSFKQLMETFQEDINKLKRIIFTIELYMGMSEDIHQISFGKIANDDIQYSIRQRKLFMDEEVGDVHNQGIDMDSIEKFDEWLLMSNPYFKCKNYEFLVPEEKCIVAINVRRNDKKYHENPFINKMMNADNHKTYLLIRNGENIYRIWSELNIDKDMFPNSDRLTELNEQMFNGYGSRRKDAEKTIERYKLNMILIQGLIERTECFPYERSIGLSLFKQENLDKVNYIYDADTSRQLPSNVLTFDEFVVTLNKDTGKGNRIYWFGDKFIKETGYKNVADAERTLRYYRYESRSPRLPSSGLYLIEEVDYNDKKTLIYKFQPSDFHYRDWYLTDKNRNRESFIFEPIDDNDYYINYDNLTRENINDLEFYINTRLDRRRYLTNIPRLMEILAFKREDIRKEDDFIKLALNMSNMDSNNDFQKGIDALEWWKLKNMWKRSLTVDDSKALRMIVKKLKKENGK